MNQSLLLHGAKVYLYINGRPCGKTVSFQWGISYTRIPYYGVDVHEPVEFIPGSSRVHGTVTLYRLIGDGGAEGMGIVAPIPDLTLEKYFTLALVDRQHDTTVFQANSCTCTDQRWEAVTRSLMVGTLAFEALTYNNEIQPMTASRV